MCERDEEEVTGDDGGGVKIGEACCNNGKIGAAPVGDSASPLVSASVTRLGEVDVPLRVRKIGGRGVSAACVA